MRTSEISGFYKLSREARLKTVKEFANLSDDELKILSSTGSLGEIGEHMIENVVGTMPLPLGIAVNFLINGKDYLIPMAIEEPSVVAAASNAAKLARIKGGFFTTSTDPLMIGQIQITNVKSPYKAKFDIYQNKNEILKMANERDPMLVQVGGGAKDVEVRVLDTERGPMVIVHLIVDCRDAMGANAVNSMCEYIAPYLEEITGGKVYLRILSNLAVYRLARATALFDKDALGGENVVDGIIYAHLFALHDPFRCATHNKGIMNGIDAVIIATGNDWRAIEAGAHAYATINGGYKPLTTWEKNSEGHLVGTIEVPLAVGLIGGATATHPVAKVTRKILGIKNARELAEIISAVGLAQNFAAIKALATEGIQRGHMELHARNIAISAGAKDDEIDRVVEVLVRDKKIRMDYAKEVLEKLRSA